MDLMDHPPPYAEPGPMGFQPQPQQGYPPQPLQPQPQGYPPQPMQPQPQGYPQQPLQPHLQGYPQQPASAVYTQQSGNSKWAYIFIWNYAIRQISVFAIGKKIC